MAKSREAFRTISEVSTALDTPTHVLRFWESKFAQIKPVKRAGGRRYYRPEDVDLLAGIKTLLHDHGMTIKGAQKLLKEQGVKYVAALGENPAPAVSVPQDVQTEAVQPPLTIGDELVATVPEVEPVQSAVPDETPREIQASSPRTPATRTAILADIAIPNQIMISKNAVKIADLIAKLETLRNRMQAQ